MDHMELQDLADCWIDEAREIIPTLDEDEVGDLLDVVKDRISKIQSQLKCQSRRHPDGTPFTEPELARWRKSATGALSCKRLVYSLARTHAARLRRERAAELDRAAERFRTVAVGGTMGVLEAVYLIASEAIPHDDRSQEQRTALRAARQILDHAKRQAVGA